MIIALIFNFVITTTKPIQIWPTHPNSIISIGSISTKLSPTPILFDYLSHSRPLVYSLSTISSINL